MHVSNIQHCDFVVWSLMEEPFVQRIKYDSTSMGDNTLKVHDFGLTYFMDWTRTHGLSWKQLLNNNNNTGIMYLL